MIPICLNHRRMTYDFCRSCPNGRDLDCPEYLSDIEHTRQDKTQNSRMVSSSHSTSPPMIETRDSRDKTAENFTRKSSSVEKPIEGCAMCTDQIRTTETTNEVFDRSTRISTTVSNSLTHSESYSRPVVLLQNVRSKVEPMLPRPDFLERFRRYQR